jgi:DNA-binding SARP family transcriptional activator
MAGQRNRSRDWPYTRDNDYHSDAGHEQLNEAVTELRSLLGKDLRTALKHLPVADDIREASHVGGGNVHTLLLWSARFVRLAAELDAAARCCRAIDKELRHQIDELLEDLPVSLGTAGLRDHSMPPADPRPKGLVGWLKLISQHSGATQEAQYRQGTIGAGDAEPGRPSSPSSSLTGAPEADAEVLTLGPLELRVSGNHVVRWNNLKARAVFQYLLIHHGRPVRRDALMDLQWPDHTVTSARNNLNVALHSLRSTLGGPWNGLQPILYRDGCYVLNTDLKWWIDREEFLSAIKLGQILRLSGNPRQTIRNYERALQLYRGPLFEDDVSGDWYLSEQRRLNDLYLEALEGLGQIYFDLGELTPAESFGRRALSSDPCCESAHRLMMRCYASEHRQDLVTRQYRLCVDALRDELGVSPGEETFRLFCDLTSVSH